MSTEATSVAEFISSPKVEEPNEDTCIVKAETNTEIVRAPTAEELKKQRAREAYQRKKERIVALKNNQVHGCKVILFNINSKIHLVDVASEADYRKLIEDLLGTLKDNELLSDYLLDER